MAARRSRFLVCLAFSFSIAFVYGQSAKAIPPFWQEFQEKFVKPDAADEKAKEFAKLASATKCNVCHANDEKKTERNPFGQALDELLDKDDFKKERLDSEADKVKQEILAAFEKVAERKAVPDDENSPTFGQLIAEGKLPGDPENYKPKEEKETPKQEEQPAEQQTAESETSQDRQTTLAANSTGGLAAALFAQLENEVKAELKETLKAELSEQLKKEISAELKAELKSQIKESLKPVIMAELNAVTEFPPEVEAKAIEEIQKIGGTVMDIAQNDDSKTVAFHLSGKDLDNGGLQFVKNVGKLIELNLKDTKITDEGLANLSSLVTLKRLNLARTQVSDKGLAYLKGLDNVAYLNLYGSQVTDAGLEHLKGMTNLKKLYLWQSKVTEGGVNRLQEELPGCEINFQ